MAANFTDIELKGVETLDKEVGRGAYGKVYLVKYCETICAAKEIHSILVENADPTEMKGTIQSFLRECRQSNKLRHPNIIQCLGVYYPPRSDQKLRLPVMVMELMNDSLVSFIKKHQDIPQHLKYSILHDVSLGLCYLHGQNPPILHRDLSSNNILLTKHCVAKISDLGVAKVKHDSKMSKMTNAPGTQDFMPPEALSEQGTTYGLPIDVFSFAGIILHTFTQEWPAPSGQTRFDLKTKRLSAFTEVQRRQQYLDKLTGAASKLKSLVEKCLDNNPDVRPPIANICKTIKSYKDSCKEGPSSDIMELLQKINKLQTDNKELKENIPPPVPQRKNRPVSAGKVPVVDSVDTKWKKDAPPIMPALLSGRYRIKWTQLSDAPVRMYDAYATAQAYNKVFVAGCTSPAQDAKFQVYVYDIATNVWDQLPSPQISYGIPQVIGDKLAIIGGRRSMSQAWTNKVSTFDNASQTWLSYYPDLLSVRAKPGVVTYLEHVIVAGGGKGCHPLEVQTDIEVLNWIENTQWSKVDTTLPEPMWAFSPVISDDNLYIVGFSGVDKLHNSAYCAPVASVTASGSAKSKWTKLAPSLYYGAAIVPGLSPIMTVGGQVQGSSSSTSDVTVYDASRKSWNSISALLFSRSSVAVASIGANAFITIGGCITAGKVDVSKSTSVANVELAQAEYSPSK